MSLFSPFFFSSRLLCSTHPCYPFLGLSVLFVFLAQLVSCPSSLRVLLLLPLSHSYFCFLFSCAASCRFFLMPCFYFFPSSFCSFALCHRCENVVISCAASATETWVTLPALSDVRPGTSLPLPYPTRPSPQLPSPSFTSQPNSFAGFFLPFFCLFFLPRSAPPSLTTPHRALTPPYLWHILLLPLLHPLSLCPSHPLILICHCFPSNNNLDRFESGGHEVSSCRYCLHF